MQQLLSGNLFAKRGALGGRQSKAFPRLALNAATKAGGYRLAELSRMIAEVGWLPASVRERWAQMEGDGTLDPDAIQFA